MGRRRSAIVRKAGTNWQGITRLSAQSVYSDPQQAAAFFQAELSMAKRLEVEIGSGNGDFIVQAAKINPAMVILGIEYAQKFMRLVRDRVVAANLTNVRLLCSEAKMFVRHGLPDQSVDSFHIYFPDPWPKRGQQKKRSMSPEGLREMHRALKKDGSIYFVTDHASYFEAVRKSLPNLDLFQTIREAKVTELNDDGFTAYSLHTHFGRRYLRLGKPVFCLTLQKK